MKKDSKKLQFDSITKRLVIVCIFTTFVAISIWLYYFLSVTKADALPSTGSNLPSVDTLANFNLKFDQEQLILPLNEEQVISLKLDGSVEDIISAKSVIQYDSSVIEVVNQTESTLFDFYIGNSVDSAQGLMTLSGALTKTSSKKSGTFSQITIKRIAEGETAIKLFGESEGKQGGSQYSKVVTVYGPSYPTQTQIIKIL
ncbi:hypothetical protein KC678_04120 [Candidatus Dojkabacteria bacterium]|uniref:Cohesin domain-containing protein n=1 Tax=Candidatus Dojkabacteria bacterium TaxID=2099670 RepID=A0A955L204_9BACT|nr:hypothetical protein [Candidatus Dojkabacteria bacterium]